ncbi:hypothetical protein SNEBB_002708 [Seison nebaliae]|nr:hypothetical protein SNEBB_002708 [Seison nebaliae]
MFLLDSIIEKWEKDKKFSLVEFNNLIKNSPEIDWDKEKCPKFCHFVETINEQIFLNRKLKLILVNIYLKRFPKRCQGNLSVYRRLHRWLIEEFDKFSLSIKEDQQLLNLLNDSLLLLHLNRINIFIPTVLETIMFVCRRLIPKNAQAEFKEESLDEITNCLSLPSLQSRDLNSYYRIHLKTLKNLIELFDRIIHSEYFMFIQFNFPIFFAFLEEFFDEQETSRHIYVDEIGGGEEILMRNEIYKQFKSISSEILKEIYKLIEKFVDHCHGIQFICELNRQFPKLCIFQLKNFCEISRNGESFVDWEIIGLMSVLNRMKWTNKILMVHVMENQEEFLNFFFSLSKHLLIDFQIEMKDEELYLKLYEEYLNFLQFCVVDGKEEDEKRIHRILQIQIVNLLRMLNCRTEIISNQLAVTKSNNSSISTFPIVQHVSFDESSSLDWKDDQSTITTSFLLMKEPKLILKLIRQMFRFISKYLINEICIKQYIHLLNQLRKMELTKEISEEISFILTKFQQFFQNTKSIDISTTTINHETKLIEENKKELLCDEIIENNETDIEEPIDVDKVTISDINSSHSQELVDVDQNDIEMELEENNIENPSILNNNEENTQQTESINIQIEPKILEKDSTIVGNCSEVESSNEKNSVKEEKNNDCSKSDVIEMKLGELLSGKVDMNQFLSSDKSFNIFEVVDSLKFED